MDPDVRMYFPEHSGNPLTLILVAQVEAELAIEAELDAAIDATIEGLWSSNFFDWADCLCQQRKLEQNMKVQGEFISCTISCQYLILTLKFWLSLEEEAIIAEEELIKMEEEEARQAALLAQGKANVRRFLEWCLIL